MKIQNWSKPAAQASWPSDPGAALTAEQQRMARIVRTIEGEIVPRLVLARRVKVDTPAAQVRQNELPDELDVKEMVRLLLAHETGVASAFVDTIRQRGANLESICLDLLAPAARELGLLWEEDECDFMQVTVGLCRLHQVLRELTPAFVGSEINQEGERRILLAVYPGDQHTFGVTLVAQFLRRAGWDVWQECPASIAELLDTVREHSFAAIGLSLGCETRLDSLPDSIRAIRAASRNRAVGVLLGGPMFVAQPELAVSLGADASAVDGRDAVKQLEQVHSGGWRREFGVPDR